MKILFLYPNTPLLNPPPVSIGLFTALLRGKGHDVRVFDTTFYIQECSSDKAKEENLQVRPFAFDEKELPLSKNSLSEDLLRVLREYKPDLVTLSVLESTWFQGQELLDVLDETDRPPVLVGGIFATFAPDIVLCDPKVDMVCIGEGEGPLLDVCDRIADGRSCADIPNLWVKDRRTQAITKNPVRPVLDLNTLPVPDYSVFHPARFLRPMAGRIYRTVPIETNRGCPYTCTFCNSPSMAELYRNAEAGRFFRKKTLQQIQTELRQLITTWDAEYVYFPSDTFLVMSDEEFDTFIDIYSEFKLPFWIQSRAETITRYRAQKLKDIGCHRMSIGLEQGNEDFRTQRLKKRYKNTQMIRAAHILDEVGIPLSVNNILGFPDETRELIFDTIELNRQIPTDTTNAYAFVPFHGTPMHKYCVEQGWISPEHTFGSLTIDLPLDMPQLGRDEIKGLRKTFALYAKLPKKYWADIRTAETDGVEGSHAMKELRKIFLESNWNDAQD